MKYGVCGTYIGRFCRYRASKRENPESSKTVVKIGPLNLICHAGRGSAFLPKWKKWKRRQCALGFFMGGRATSDRKGEGRNVDPKGGGLACFLAKSSWKVVLGGEMKRGIL